MGSLRHDVSYGLRTLVRSPGYAAVTMIILALGIGANTAMFGILNGLILRELPVSRPEQLVEISGIYRNGSKVQLSFPMFRELGRGQHVFSGLFGWSGIVASNVDANGALFLAGVRAVTGDYFSGLGERPLLGRVISPEDVGGGASSQVAVIGYEYWDRRFGRDPAIIGRAIRIEGRLFTIIGVTPRWFTGMSPGEPQEITIPFTASQFDPESRSALWVFATGRLNDGITLEQARGQLQSFWPAVLEATVPAQSAGPRRQSFLSMRLEIESAATGINPVFRSQFLRPLYIVMGVVGLILLVVCVNLASLTLARAAARGREVSARVALGASAGHIVRQFLTESFLLTTGGAILALAFADWGSRFLITLMTKGSLFPITLDLSLDWRVFSFTASTAVVTGLLIGLAPAWLMSRLEPISVLRRTERTLGRGAGTLGKALIVTQIALSLVLLQGAGIFLRTLASLRSFDPGFQKERVLEMSLYPRPGAYKGLDMAGYRRQLIERVAGLPGILSVAFSNLPVPAGEKGWKDTVVSIEGDSNPSGNVLATLAVVSPDFFKTLGIPVVSGRDLDWTDDGQHPRVAVVDSNLARRLLLTDETIRRRIRFGVQPEFQNLEIVGVARSARLIDLRNADSPVVYVPCLQHPSFSQRGNLFVRANHPATHIKTVDHQIQSIGHEYSTDASTLTQMSERALLRERATALLSTFFASVALLLAGIGLFGLMSYTVSRRTREVGIRMALGSPRRDILRIVLRETLLLTLLGLAVGVPCALAATRLAAHMLFGVSANDPVTLATVSGTLLGVAAIAGYLPARRAMKMDPLVALRYE